MRRLALVPIVTLSLATFADRSLADDGPDCLAWNNDVSFATNVTSIGVTRAVRLDLSPATGPVTVAEARIFTGLVTAESQLGIWSHNPTQNAPAAPLGEASFTVKSSLGWQGAAFTAPVELQAGQTIWLVWDAPVGAQMPWAPPKSYVGQPHRISYNGGSSWMSQVFQSSASHFKIRLIGACACGTSLQKIGVGCAGSAGHVPTLAATSCPTVGNNLAVSLGHGLGGAWSIVVFGDKPGKQQLFGTDCDLLLTPVRPPLLFQPLAGAGAGAGWLSLNGALSTSVSGQTLTMQAFVIDPGVARGFSASAGLRINIP